MRWLQPTRSAVHWILGVLIGVMLGYLFAQAQASTVAWWPLVISGIAFVVLTIVAIGLTDPVVGWIRRQFIPAAPPHTGTHGYLTRTYRPGSESLHRALTISESTRGRRADRFVETGFRPTAVDFVRPTAKRLNPGDLPGWVWCGRGSYGSKPSVQPASSCPSTTLPTTPTRSSSTTN
jgi:hypothetical protein